MGCFDRFPLYSSLMTRTLADGTAPRFHVAEWFTLQEDLSLQHLTLVSVDFLTAVCRLSEKRLWVGKGEFSSLTPLLLSAAGLMHTFNAHAATDITGFGILGHAQNLAKQQRNEVSFVIHNLPVLAKMAAVSKACGNMFGLMHGTCPETSGTGFCSLIKLGKPWSPVSPHFVWSQVWQLCLSLLWVCGALQCDAVLSPV